MSQDFEIDVIQRLLGNNVWSVEPVSEVPSIVLSSWSIWDAGPYCVFVGYNETHGEGRVSTAIQAFDPTTLRGRTSSGRVYQLKGRPGAEQHGSYVWDVAKRSWGIVDPTDITEAVLKGYGNPFADGHEVDTKPKLATD